MNTSDIIHLPVTKQIIQKTADNTIKKYLFTCKNLSYKRTPVELLDNLYMGDLAKNSLVEYFRQNNVPVIDYDEIRTDNFQNHDPGWDIKIGTNEIMCEIKSSIPPNNESDENIISYRDIKIIASHNKGMTMLPPENIESQLHFQIYFRAKAYRQGYESMEQLANVLQDNPAIIHKIINSEKYNNPLFFGWATKSEIINYSKTLNTWTFSWTDTIYWPCPIKKAHTLNQLITKLQS